MKNMHFQKNKFTKFFRNLSPESPGRIFPENTGFTRIQFPGGKVNMMECKNIVSSFWGSVYSLLNTAKKK